MPIHPATSSPRGTLSEALTESEQLLIVEALHRLREIKQRALAGTHTEGLLVDGRQFEERDFGIPQIERLLSRFDAE